MASKPPDDDTGFETSSELRREEPLPLGGDDTYLYVGAGVGCFLLLVLLLVAVILYFLLR
jgi:hypothetical protein